MNKRQRKKALKKERAQLERAMRRLGDVPRSPGEKRLPRLTHRERQSLSLDPRGSKGK